MKQCDAVARVELPHGRKTTTPTKELATGVAPYPNWRILYMKRKENNNMWVERSFKFDAAHQLPQHPGKCANKHGHTWRGTIAVEGNVQDNGMVLDFSELKVFIELITSAYDHRDLNQFFSNPTVETIITAILATARNYLCSQHDHITRIRVTLQEGDGGTAWDEISSI